MAYEAVIGLECHVQLRHAHQDVLRLPDRVRRGAEHATSARCASGCRARCRG